MAEKTIATQSVQILRPKARILRIFGDELVSSEIVAITELVKNSYDADATRVLIRFTGPLEANQGAIEVIDNGHGMSLDDIQKTWMEPATPYRKRKTRSKWYGRRVLGEKGIGRFAASRLANYLEVITRQKETDEELHVFFDWTQFDDDEKYLDEIGVSYQKTKAIDISPSGIIRGLWSDDEIVDEDEMVHGTIMRMQGLRKTWTEAQIELLRTNLSRFISPFFKQSQAQRGNNLVIYIKFPPPFESFSRLIESPDILDYPLYSVKGHVNGDGYFDLTFKLKGEEEHEAGQFSFKKIDKLRCGPFDIELRVWDRDVPSLNDYGLKYGMKVAEIRSLLDEAAGISIYRDGFRVLPYGEPKTDWLRLDLRRVQNPERLSNNQIVGYVLISADDNPSLRDQSNREGIIEDGSLEDLGKLIINVLSRLEPRIIAFRKRAREEKRKQKQENSEQSQDNTPHQQYTDKPSAPKIGIFTGFELEHVHNYIKDRHPKDKELLALIGAKDREIEIHLKQVQDVIAQYQRLAILGGLIDKILHDGRAPLSKIGNEALLGLRDIKRSKLNAQELIQKLDQRLNFIKTQSDALDRVFKKIEPFGGRKRGRPVQISLIQAISNAISVLDEEAVKEDVQVILPKTDIQFLADSVEIQEIIYNLLDNSLYWLGKVHNKEQRKICIQIDQKNQDEVEIIFSDSGPGVDPKFKDNIFDPYFSLKPNGIGLGLTIAGEIITEYYNGSLELIENGPLPGATFRVTLGRRI